MFSEEYASDEEYVPARNLPVEVISCILHYLNHSDRKSARLVSRSWYEAGLDKSLLLKEVVDFSHNAAMVSNTTPVQDILGSNRIFYHFHFKEQDVSWRMQEFWRQFAPYLKSLYLFNCDVRERDFTSILALCVSLESLRTSGLRELFMSGSLLRDKEEVLRLQIVLANLKELWVQHNNYLSDALFDRLTLMAPNLESLSVEGCRVSFHPGIYKKFYPSKQLEETGIPDKSDSSLLQPSSSILSFKNILRYIRSRAKHIHSLNIGCTLIDSAGLTELAQIEELKLRALRLPNCEQLTNTGVVALTEYQTSLTCLNLSLCSRVTDPSLIAVCAYLPNLEDLSIRRCRAITDIGVAELKHLKKLVSLDISQCDQVTSDGISKGLCGCLNETMRRLNLSGINNMTQDTVIDLTKCLPNITHLNLSYCYTAVTDSTVQAIFQNQSLIQVLRLTGCGMVTDAGLTGMGNAVSGNVLETQQPFEPSEPLLGGQSRFRISLRSRAEDDIIRDAEHRKAVLQLCEDISSSKTPFGYSLAKLRGLRQLDLANCSRISDVSLRYAFKFLELQSLNISQCCQITVDGLKALTINNPSIETLTLSKCLNVCDDSVLSICQNLKRLKNLDLSGCEKLTKKSWDAIINHCKHLRDINVSRCYRMDHEDDSLLISSVLDDGPPRPSAPPLPSKKRMFTL